MPTPNIRTKRKVVSALRAHRRGMDDWVRLVDHTSRLRAETANQFLRRADTCLYAAKHAGRDRVVSEADAAILTAAETEAA